jgi:hypothetical protein
MRVSGVVGALFLVLAFVSGCSDPQRLPDPDDPAVKAAEARLLPDRANPAVRAEEARLAKVVGADTSLIASPGICKIRLMGQKAGASFVYAECTAIAPIEPGATEHTASAGPLRVDGSKVTQAGDGTSGECPALYDTFPKDLADLVCRYGYNGKT